MNIISIIILGIIQGIAEFLPISSSAHLLIFRDICKVGVSMSADMALSFDVALHLGTLLAIGVFFFKDFLNMIQKGLTKGVKDKEGKILWYLVVATIPAGIAGILFEDFIENIIRNNFVIIALALIVMGIALYYADKCCKSNKDIKDFTVVDAIIIGCSQVLALIPGFSRSGTTITAGRVLGINREDAAKFSFYLSAPVVLGAVVLQLLESTTWSIIAANALPFIIGIVSAFVIGLFCIKYLLKYLHSHDFKIFMIYRIVLAISVLVWILIR